MLHGTPSSLFVFNSLNLKNERTLKEQKDLLVKDTRQPMDVQMMCGAGESAKEINGIPYGRTIFTVILTQEGMLKNLLRLANPMSERNLESH